MRFKISLHTTDSVIPINYQYTLSAAIYKTIAKGNAEYAALLHETGYGKVNIGSLGLLIAPSLELKWPNSI